MDIPLRYAQIIWDYHGDDPDAPPITVVGYDDEGKRLPYSPRDDRDYFCSWGVCNSEFSQASDWERLLLLFEKFQELVTAPVRRLDPLVVHEAFSVIPEYRVSLIWRGLGSTIPDDCRNEEADEEAVARMQEVRDHQPLPLEA